MTLVPHHVQDIDDGSIIHGEIAVGFMEDWRKALKGIGEAFAKDAAQAKLRWES